VAPHLVPSFKGKNRKSTALPITVELPKHDEVRG
jgi:hypothetical protein